MCRTAGQIKSADKGAAMRNPSAPHESRCHDRIHTVCVKAVFHTPQLGRAFSEYPNLPEIIFPPILVKQTIEQLMLTGGTSPLHFHIVCGSDEPGRPPTVGLR